MVSAADSRDIKAKKVKDLQKLIRDWKPVDRIEEYHTALAALVEAIDMKDYIDDEIRRNEFDHALEKAKKLLENNGW